MICDLDNPQLQQLQQTEPRLCILDVRTEWEHRSLGFIPGAVLLPLQMLPMTLSRLSEEVPTVLVCEHGVRSLDAAQFLAHHGFHSLYNLTMGMAAWDGDRVFDPTAATPLTSLQSVNQKESQS